MERGGTMSGWVVGLVVACRGPEPVQDPPEPTPVPAPQPVVHDTVETGTTPTDTGTPPLPEPSCDELPEGPYEWISSSQVHTEEDFDFDRDGFLVLQSYQDLVGITRDGMMSVIGTNVGIDVAGIRTLPTDDYVVAQQDTAALRRVNHVN